jgi:hypothetical protein
MANKADSIPVEDRYLRALGRATYNFAYLEWGIVWLTESIDFGFLNKARQLTANKIAKNFKEAVDGLSNQDPEKVALQSLAVSFIDLVKDRDGLMHGNPYSTDGGEQRLLYDGRHGRKDWSVQLIDEFSELTATASIEAGRLLHGGRLANYQNYYGQR